MPPRREAWQHLPVAEPVSESMTRGMPETLVGNYQHMQETAGSDDGKHAASGDGMPEIDACGRFLLWMATVVSCCTITDWSQTTKAQMWRSRVSLMMIYMVLLVSTGITMFAFYGGYEKLTVLDDQGQRTMLVFGEGSLVEQLAWDPLSSCGKDTEGITTFTNHSEHGLFGGLGPDGCTSVYVPINGSSVIFEDVTRGQVMSHHVNKSNSAEFICRDGTYLIRALGGEGGAIPDHKVLVYSSATSAPVVVEKQASQWHSTTMLRIENGRAQVVPNPPCARLSVTSAPDMAIWELAAVDSAGGTFPIVGAVGASTGPATVCAPMGGAHFIFRLYDAQGTNIMAKQGTSCEVSVQGADGASTAYVCGSGSTQDVAVLHLDSTQAPRFIAPSSASADCSTFTSSAPSGTEWWLISPSGTTIQEMPPSGQLVLCDRGTYEYSLSSSSSGDAVTAFLQLSNSQQTGPPATKEVTGTGLDATAVFTVDGRSAKFLSPSAECLRANVEFDSITGGSDWELSLPERFPRLLASTVRPWQLPSLSGDAANPPDRYLCQRGPYALEVKAGSSGSGDYDNFKLAFNGDATSPLPSCSLSYCFYHGCASTGGGLFGALQSMQDSADSAWEGLGNEEGSLDIDITEVTGSTTPSVEPVNCGYSSGLDGKDPPTGGKPASDVVYFVKEEGSTLGTLFQGVPDQWTISYQTAPKSEEVMMFCKPVQCPNVPPMAPSPPPPPPSTTPPSPSAGFFDSDSPGMGSLLLDGGEARQCHPLMCNSPAGEALEYQCWEAQSESTGLMAVMTMVALIVCPLGWFIIKLLGIKAEAYLNEEKEAEEHGEGCCQFPCFFCCTFCGCSCGIGSLKVIKFCLTFGANAILAINLSFAYDAANDQYFADIFAATTWLAYFTIVFMLVNACWGLCNFRDVFKSSQELKDEDAKFSKDGWSPNMCCQLIIGMFALGGVLVGVFVWGANAVQELGAYVYTLEELMAIEITGEQIANAFKKLAMGIALIHPDLWQLPKLTPIVLQINISITICLGPIIFLLDLIAQLPFKLIAGCLGLGSRMAEVVPFAGGEAVTRGDVAEKLAAGQAKVGGKLQAKDDIAAKKQRGDGLDGKLHNFADDMQGKIDEVQGRVEQVQGGLDDIGTFQSEGVTGLLKETTVVDIVDDPWAHAEEEATSRINARMEEETFGRLDKMDAVDETRQQAAAARRRAK